MKPSPYNAAALLVACAFTSAVHASTEIGEHVTVSGFGTLGLVKTNTDDAEYRPDNRQSRGAKSSFDAGVDSKLGLQANVKFNDTFTGVGQVLLSRRINDEAALEWFYGQAKLPAGFDLKIGRMVLPTFMVSDSRSVGYSTHLLRAPIEVYSLYPPSSFDGGQLVYRNSLGAINLTAQASIGRAKADVEVFGMSSELELTGLKSLNVLLEHGDWLLRFGQTVADGKTPSLPIPPTTDTFSGIGVQYDNATVVVSAEYVTRRQDGLQLLDNDSFYVSGGWRLGRFTPYIALSEFKPKGLAYPSRDSDKTVAVGLRWDLAPNVALKAQFESRQGVNIGYTKETPAFTAEKPKVRITSLAMDFVF